MELPGLFSTRVNSGTNSSGSMRPEPSLSLVKCFLWGSPPETYHWSIWGWLKTANKSGWWLTYLSEKYEFVDGKDDIPHTYILMVCFFLGVSWKCNNFGCFRKFKSFQKKKGRFVEFCSWPWPFTLIGTGCRTCWLPRNLFDKTLLHSQSSRSFSGYLKPNYAKLFEWGLSKDPLPVHRLLWFSQGNGLCPSKNKGDSTRKCAFSLGKNAFSPGKSAFSIFFMFFNITFMSYLFH